MAASILIIHRLQSEQFEVLRKPSHASDSVSKLSLMILFTSALRLSFLAHFRPLLKIFAGSRFDLKHSRASGNSPEAAEVFAERKWSPQVLDKIQNDHFDMFFEHFEDFLQPLTLILKLRAEDNPRQ